MGKLAFDSSQLQNSRFIYGYARWKNAFKVVGSIVRRSISNFFNLCRTNKYKTNFYLNKKVIKENF